MRDANPISQLAADVRDGLKHRQRGTGSTKNTEKYLLALDALVARVADLEAQVVEHAEDLARHATACADGSVALAAAEAQVAALTLERDEWQAHYHEARDGKAAAEAALADTREVLADLWDDFGRDQCYVSPGLSPGLRTRIRGALAAGEGTAPAYGPDAGISFPDDGGEGTAPTEEPA